LADFLTQTESVLLFREIPEFYLSPLSCPNQAARLREALTIPRLDQKIPQAELQESKYMRSVIPVS